MNEENKTTAKNNTNSALVAAIDRIYYFVLKSEHADYRQEVGFRIQKERLKKGLTLEKFGKLFKPVASKSLVSRWESGKRIPSAERQLQLSKITGQPVDYFSPELSEKSDYYTVLNWLKDLKKDYSK